MGGRRYAQPVSNRAAPTRETVTAQFRQFIVAIISPFPASTVNVALFESSLRSGANAVTARREKWLTGKNFAPPWLLELSSNRVPCAGSFIVSYVIPE